MQCARCAKPLPAGAQICPACGWPVATNSQLSVDEGASIQPSGAASGSMSQGNAAPTYTGFAFQEFNSTPTAFPPAVLPGMPGMPGQATPYPPFSPPGASAKPKRRGRSVGCIVLYALLAIFLVFVGLGVALYAIGSHLASVNQTNQAAAMRLYQQVTSQTPIYEDSLTNPTQSEWRAYQRANYGCSIEQDGLHIHIADAGHFVYCLDGGASYTNFAFQVRMSMLSGAGGGLVFRLDREEDAFYLFQISPTGAYGIYVDKAPSTGTRSLARGVVNAGSLQLNQTSTLTVIAKGAVFDFYLGQQFIVQAQDKALQNGGYLGMIAYDRNSPAEVLYTNAKIWDLDM